MKLNGTIEIYSAGWHPSLKIRREHRKNRELLWHLLQDKNCAICHKPLLPKKDIKFGMAEAGPLGVKLVIHHQDGDHSNNDISNRKIVHQSCHKAMHMKQTKPDDFRKVIQLKRAV